MSNYRVIGSSKKGTGYLGKAQGGTTQT